MPQKLRLKKVVEKDDDADGWFYLTLVIAMNTFTLIATLIYLDYTKVDLFYQIIMTIAVVLNIIGGILAFPMSFISRRVYYEEVDYGYKKNK